MEDKLQIALRAHLVHLGANPSPVMVGTEGRAHPTNHRRYWNSGVGKGSSCPPKQGDEFRSQVPGI